MTIQKLASEIAKREGKKTQARIGEIREILRILVELECEAEFHNSQGPTSIIVDQEFKMRKKVWKRLENEEEE